MITDSEQGALESLGKRLEQLRLSRNESQASLAARIGISVMTYQRMAKGLPTISIGHWVRALRLLSSLEKLDGLFEIQSSFFDDKDRSKSRIRKRAKKRSVRKLK